MGVCHNQICFVIILCIACTSCGNRSENTNNATASFKVIRNHPTEEEVLKIAREGSPKSAILKAFGNPFKEDAIDNSNSCAIYSYPPDMQKGTWENRFSGFTVFYQNDVVTRCLPSYDSLYAPQIASRKTTTNQSTEGNNTNAAKYNSISFYIVSGSGLEHGLYLDTPELPKVGYVPAMPTFSVSHLKSVKEISLTVNQNPTKDKRSSLELDFEDEDAKAFKALTENNLGAKVLIEVGHVPVSVVRIVEPVNSGTLMVANLDEAAFGTLMQASKAIVNQ
jgi:hypothetical protein